MLLPTDQQANQQTDRPTNKPNQADMKVHSVVTLPLIDFSYPFLSIHLPMKKTISKRTLVIAWLYVTSVWLRTLSLFLHEYVSFFDLTNLSISVLPAPVLPTHKIIIHLYYLKVDTFVAQLCRQKIPRSKQKCYCFFCLINVYSNKLLIYLLAKIIL